MNLKEYIASVPNYPKEGIIFRDISPLMANGKAYQYATQQIVDYARKIGAEMIVGPEARGFIVGCPVAYELGIGFAPARKKGKLPRETVAVEYLLATGGTMAAAAKLVEKLGGEVVGLAFLVELTDLKGREKISEYDIFTLMEYTEDER